MLKNTVYVFDRSASDSSDRLDRLPDARSDHNVANIFATEVKLAASKIQSTGVTAKSTGPQGRSQCGRPGV